MVGGWHKKSLLLVALALLAVGVTGRLLADDEDVAVERTYIKTADAPRGQSQEEADAKSAGCISCHTKSDAPSMHDNVAVVLGCADCHGGDASVKAAPRPGDDRPAICDVQGQGACAAALSR